MLVVFLKCLIILCCPSIFKSEALEKIVGNFLDLEEGQFAKRRSSLQVLNRGPVILSVSVLSLGLLYFLREEFLCLLSR